MSLKQNATSRMSVTVNDTECALVSARWAVRGDPQANPPGEWQRVPSQAEQPLQARPRRPCPRVVGVQTAAGIGTDHGRYTERDPVRIARATASDKGRRRHPSPHDPHLHAPILQCWTGALWCVRLRRTPRKRGACHSCHARGGLLARVSKSQIRYPLINPTI
jgi:hypothetical protein